MGKTKSMTVDMKKEVIKLFEEGKTQAKIANICCLSQPSVSNVIKEWKITNCVTCHKKGAGRPKVTNPRSLRILRRIISKEPFSSIAEYTHALNEKGLDISRATVHRRMGDLNYLSRVPNKKPLLNKKQRLRRMKWAKIYQKMDTNFWNRIVFSDECSFTLPMSKNGKVWRKQSEEYSPKCIRRTVKHPASVMVWGCMTSHGLGRLKFVEGIINSVKYQEILDDSLISSLHLITGEKSPIFQQDLAPPHNFKSTKEWLSARNIDVLEWPANSPDLNPIENIWKDIKFLIKKQTVLPKTKEELRKSIVALWENYPSEKCQNLIFSLQRRCAAVIASKGYATKY